MLGIKYNSNYFTVQGDLIFGTVTNAAFKQLNIQLVLYPLGNLNVYGFSTIYIRQNETSGTNFKQVIGTKILKNFWVEGNTTLGIFKNLAENDALYLYNAIDANKFKGGITGYLSLNKKCIAQLGYTFEQRELYKRTTTFNQHSITGGLSWKF
jgi:tRNA G10  N-methylase Trm11